MVNTMEAKFTELGFNNQNNHDSGIFHSKLVYFIKALPEKRALSSISDTL